MNRNKERTVRRFTPPVMMLLGMLAMLVPASCNPDREQVQHEQLPATEVAAKTYELKLEVKFPVGGEVTGAGEYRAGERVTIEAHPFNYFEFLRWVDLDRQQELSRDDRYSFTMPEHDLHIGAWFIDLEEWR